MNIKARLAELALGHTVNKLIVNGFDFVLYPMVMLWFGLVWGFIIMAFLSLLVCWLTMKFYDWSMRDWLGIEAIKEIRQYGGMSRSRKWLAWVMQKSDPIACLLLSIQFDPFVVTVYLRRGRFGGMNHADWRNFLLSWLIGNIHWSIICFTGVSALTWAWRWITRMV